MTITVKKNPKMTIKVVLKRYIVQTYISYMLKLTLVITHLTINSQAE
jgi:hypothetical protein